MRSNKRTVRNYLNSQVLPMSQHSSRKEPEANTVVGEDAEDLPNTTSAFADLDENGRLRMELDVLRQKITEKDATIATLNEKILFYSKSMVHGHKYSLIDQGTATMETEGVTDTRMTCANCPEGCDCNLATATPAAATATPAPAAAAAPSCPGNEAGCAAKCCHIPVPSAGHHITPTTKRHWHCHDSCKDHLRETFGGDRGLMASDHCGTTRVSACDDDTQPSGYTNFGQH